MPSVSKRQARFMAAIAHGWKPSGMKGRSLPSRRVARDFNKADKKSGMLKRAMRGRKR